MACRPLAALLCLTLCAAPTLGVASTSTLPDFDTVRAGFRSSETLLLDRHGHVLHRLRTDFRVRRGAWLRVADISPALLRALLLSEDRRFHEHGGVDWWAVSAAAWGNLWHERTRGASTLTMQLAGLMDPTLQRSGSTPRDLIQKLAQASAARALESRWRKDQILEAYLNLVPFRGEIVGIDALSRTLFGRSADALNAPEAALAAALIRAPNAPAPRVAARACQLLQQMQAQIPQQSSRQETERASSGGALVAAASTSVPTSARASNDGAQPDCLPVEVLAGMTLHRRDWAPSEGMAPHLAQRLIRPTDRRKDGRGIPVRGSSDERGNAGGGNATHVSGSVDAGTRVGIKAHGEVETREGRPVVRSTLDAGIQRLAIETLQTQLRELRGRNVEDGAIVVLDNASGDVLAWVGSSGRLSRAAQVDGVMARRQPGSALKPFLYAQALAEHRLTAASLLDDSPTQLPTASGLYMPQNHDHRYQGWVSVRTALASSLNIPAVRTLVMVSPDAFHRQLQRLGLTFAEGSGHYGYSLALGSAEVSLLQLANAYRALANGGRWCPVRVQPRRPESCHQALDAGAAFIIGDILSDRHARLPTFGLDSVLDTRFWSAVKTGTSKDMRDNWAVGYTRRYTVGVWVGNASGAPMHDVSGTSGAAPVWAALMRELHRHEGSRAPSPPAGVVRQRVDFGGESDIPGGKPDRVGSNDHSAHALSGRRMTALDDRVTHAAGRTGIEAPRQEWFLAGTGQRHFRPVTDASTLAGKDRAGAYGAGTDEPADSRSPLPIRIIAPAPGTIIALDPDIPPANQQLKLQASAGATAGLQWFIDGQPVGQGTRLGWLPLPGRHTITLRDAQGRMLDERRIEVRGAWLRPPPGR